jgi:drug/metabolite transporter (DMT)-like permease
MLTVLIGLFAALSFGAADFAGGMGAKRLHAVAVTGAVAAVGVVVLVSVSLLSGDTWSVESAFWGGLSGLAGLGAIGLLYACLARGPMSVLSPTTAVLSALVPMTWGALTGEALSAFVYPALFLALVAAVLVGFIPDQRAVRPTPTALLMAVGSGLLIGLFYIFIDMAPADSGITPLVANRAIQTALVVMLLLALVRRKGFHSLIKPDTQWVMSWTKLWSLIIIGGVLDVTANMLILIGFRMGDMTIVAVLTALYPAGTILLAALVLHERIQPIQWVGLGLALIASMLLAQ